MNQHRSSSIFLLAILAVLLAACGGAGGGGGPATLNQTFTSADGALTLNYPQGWVVQGDSTQITVANNQAAFDNAGDPAGGQFKGVILVLPAEMATALGVTGDPSPRDVIGVFSEMAGETGTADMPTFGEPADVTIGGNAGARVEGSNSQGQASITVFESDSAWIIMIAAAAPNELAQNEATFQSIGGSVNLTAGGANATEEAGS